MSADEDSPSSPGLRALLGRLLHGLLPYRLFQLVGAALSYLVRPLGPLLLSLLPSGWVVHRSVRSSELPEVLEALGLRPGSWDELGGCLDELGPWKELHTPAMEAAELELLRSLKGLVSPSQQQDSWDSTLEGLDSWHRAMVHSNMQLLWEQGLGSWEEFAEPAQEEDECHKNTCASHTFSFNGSKHDSESGADEVSEEKTMSQLHHSYLDMVSCILRTGSGGGLFTWVDQENEHSLQAKDVQREPEIEHIRSKRLWFLQQNQGQDALNTDLEQGKEVGGFKQNEECVSTPHDSDQFVLPTPKLDVPMPELPEIGLQEIPPQSKLMLDFDLSQMQVLELPGIEQECSPCDPLSILVHKTDHSGKYVPSPDQDQGYHSLEDWHSLNITQNLKTEGIVTPEICQLGHHNVLYDMLTELPCSVTSLNDNQDSDDMSSDLEEDLPVPSVPICLNKHIGYILGTIVSNDEEDDLHSSSEDGDWDEDDGFDSEGSVPTTDSDTPVPEEAILWKSFCNPDPYNPQNFTASLQTGVVAEENSHSVDGSEHVLSDDEESWCNSDAVSGSDSEDECSADEEENLRLWNAFLKSDDPYNPLYFKASVHTSEIKRQSSDTAGKHAELTCTTLPNCELTLITSLPAEPKTFHLKETHNVPVEKSANRGHKKVTFHDKVTVYYVCNEEERKGHWEEFARDRCRFQRRIQETESLIGHCLNPDHRQMIWIRMQDKWDS